jgi:hypothetical protein
MAKPINSGYQRNRQYYLKNNIRTPRSDDLAEECVTKAYGSDTGRHNEPDPPRCYTIESIIFSEIHQSTNTDGDKGGRAIPKRRMPWVGGSARFGFGIGLWGGHAISLFYSDWIASAIKFQTEPVPK